MFYIVHKDTREVVRTSASPFNIDESVQPPSPYRQLKGVENNTVPTYAEATQKLERIFTDNDAAGTRTFSWQVTAKSQAEIDAYNKQQAENTDVTQIKQVLEDMKNGVGTATVRTARLERVLYRVAKRVLGE